MGTFDKDLFDMGLARREATLGEAYVQRSLDNADDLTRPFQEAMTAWCWGFGWGDDAIDPKTRSMMNLAMLGGLGKMHEWELHCRGALDNGVSLEEIRAICHVVAIYVRLQIIWDIRACFRLEALAHP
ncbi:MAG: carboxymuconolactone decarboxylase family protein [Roseovarius sp.]|nr:carboxymuconolactone decarboxylase family protein [Roseovarius sp.]